MRQRHQHPSLPADRHTSNNSEHSTPAKLHQLPQWTVAQPGATPPPARTHQQLALRPFAPRRGGETDTSSRASMEPGGTKPKRLANLSSTLATGTASANGNNCTIVWSSSKTSPHKAGGGSHPPKPKLQPHWPRPQRSCHQPPKFIYHGPSTN